MFVCYWRNPGSSHRHSKKLQISKTIRIQAKFISEWESKRKVTRERVEKLGWPKACMTTTR